MNESVVDGGVSSVVAELIRDGVRVILEAPPEWIEEINAAAIEGAGMQPIADDDALRRVALEINAGNLAHWAASNMTAPGVRVPVAITDHTRIYIRDLARRGLDARALDSFRTAQNVAWRRWMEICFALTAEPAVLRELLEVTSTSISLFIDDTVRELSDLIDVARNELAGDTHAERRAAVALVLEGAPIAQARAEAQLRYGLDGPHTAMVLTGDAAAPDELEAACEAVMEASAVTRRLTVLAGASELWVWFPTDAVVTEVLAMRHPTVRAAVGDAGDGREGFRRSHFEALAVQRLQAGAGTARRIATYREVRLVALVGEDRVAVDEFIAATLGDLRGADAEILECVRVWFAVECNASRAAVALYTHRNTVLRRLARADALLPIPLRDNALHIAVAIELVDWIG